MKATFIIHPVFKGQSIVIYTLQAVFKGKPIDKCMHSYTSFSLYVSCCCLGRDISYIKGLQGAYQFLKIHLIPYFNTF